MAQLLRRVSRNDRAKFPQPFAETIAMNLGRTRILRILGEESPGRKNPRGKRTAVAVTRLQGIEWNSYPLPVRAGIIVEYALLHRAFYRQPSP